MVVFENGEVQLRQPWPNQDVAAQVAPQIRASPRDAGVERVRGFRRVMRDKTKGLALRCHTRRRLSQGEACGGDVDGPVRVFLEICVDQVASRNVTRHLTGFVQSRPQRVPAKNWCKRLPGTG